MALANYTDLQASVALWLNRSDLTTVIPDFIALAESEMDKRLRTSHNETIDTAFAVTDRRTALPSDFAEMRSVFLNYGSLRVELLPLTMAGRVDDAAVPIYYGIVNHEIEVVPESTAYTLELRYWTKVPALASNTTNDVLTNFPDVYLYGSCLQAGYFLDDAQMVAKFQPMFERALEKANNTRFRQYGSGLQVRAT
jgi:hypothetical protein